jgi:UDP-glucose 4-epimerase
MGPAIPTALLHDRNVMSTASTSNGKVLLATGSSGLIGSEVVEYFAGRGWTVHGVDNNQRADFFGPVGDTRWNQQRLVQNYRAFHHHELDIRNREAVQRCVDEVKPNLLYNLGGGRANSCSIWEAFDRISALSGKKMVHEYVDRNREGDHICYISNLSKMKRHYPLWNISTSLDDIFREVYESWRAGHQK